MTEATTAVRERLAAAVAKRKAADPEWHAAIRAAYTAGIPAAEVAHLAGCSRARVYQILDTHLGDNAPETETTT